MATKVKDRPARTYLTGKVTRALRFVALTGVGVMALYVAFTYGELPDTVPTHFDFTGEADDWGPKWTIWVLVGTNAVMVALATWLSTRPRWFNYLSEITVDNAQDLYREGERLMVWVSLAVMVVFCGAILSIYEMENPFVVLGLIALPAVIITALIRMSLVDTKWQNQGSMSQRVRKNFHW